MSDKKTLLVLAAGMGSRYGGLKQVDPMGPSGEALLDYSVYDAILAGFDKLVFVIRRDFEDLFRAQVGAKYESRVEVAYAFQQLDMVPAGFSLPEGREKPWGTTHAIWCARDAVAEPFAAINADDYYGRNAYAQMAEFLSGPPAAGKPAFAMMGYRLGNTLSDHGGVTRGVCRVDPAGLLIGIEELSGLEHTGAGIECPAPEGGVRHFTGTEPVSMNFWGFTPAVFSILEEQLSAFFAEKGNELKSECFIPVSVGDMVAAGKATCAVIPTDSSWFGVTYREDKPLVQAAIRQRTEAGEYPAPLWG
jgi:hypothetical protein